MEDGNYATLAIASWNLRRSKGTQVRLNFFGKADGDNTVQEIEYLERVFSEAMDVRSKLERGWVENILFFEGQQWKQVKEIPGGRRVIESPGESDEKTLITSNIIMPLTRQAAASLRENIGRTYASPDQLDPKHVAAADMASLFLRWREEVDGEHQLRFWEILNCLMFGRVLRKTVWDPDKDGIGPTGKLMRGAGDIKTETLPPDRFVVCPTDKTPFDITWVCEHDVVDVEEIEREYGVKVDPQPVSFDTFRVNDDILRTFFSREQKSTPKDSCIRKVMWVAKSPKMPEGRCVAWVGNKMLHDGQLPDGLFPFVPIDWQWVPERVYPVSFVEGLKSLQQQYNLTLSQVVEMKNRNLRGDVFIKGGDGEYEDVIVNINPVTKQRVYRVGPEVEEYQIMTYNFRASEVNLLLEAAITGLMRTAGIHEPMLGQTPENITTATQYIMQKESDLMGLKSFKEAMDDSYCKIGLQKVLLCQKHYKVPRLVKVVGQNNETKVVALMGSDIEGVREVKISATPMITETMKSMMKKEAAAAGMYGPYQGPQDKLAKITALLNSGIPNVQEEVEQLLWPQTLEELKQQCSILDAVNGELLLQQAKAAILEAQAMQMQLTAAMQPQEQQPVDQFGNPLQPSMEEQAIQGMAGQQGQPPVPSSG